MLGIGHRSAEEVQRGDKCPSAAAAGDEDVGGEAATREAAVQASQPWSLEAEVRFLRDNIGLRPSFFFLVEGLRPSDPYFLDGPDQ